MPSGTFLTRSLLMGMCALAMLAACDQRSSQERLVSVQRQAPSAMETKTEPNRLVPPAPATQPTDVATAEPMPHYNVHFAIGSSQLSGTAMKILGEVVDYLRANPAVHVKLSGYTDFLGSTDANKVLAAERVKRTAQFFAERGIRGSRVMTVVIGEAHPGLAPFGENPETWNRRVEIEFSSPLSS